MNLNSTDFFRVRVQEFLFFEFGKKDRVHQVRRHNRVHQVVKISYAISLAGCTKHENIVRKKSASLLVLRL